jgi:YfiH family protein
VGSATPSESWCIEESAGVRVIRCAALERFPTVRHAFSTRAGSGDLGGPDSTGEELVERRRAFLRAAGLGWRRPTLLQQVHGAVVIDAVEAGGASAADGAMACESKDADWAPSVRWADCVPLLICSLDSSAVAAVHAGWRGTAAGIAGGAVARFGRMGVPPSALAVALGPAVGGCCYEVSDEVARAVAGASGAAGGPPADENRGRQRLDLRSALRRQLERAGVPAGSIHIAPWCTACDPSLFFSYRRDGARAGRQMASIGWAATARP